MNRKLSKVLKLLLVIWGVFLAELQSSAQTNAGIQQEAMDLLDKAFAPVNNSETYGITFETIAYELKNPVDIFSLPGYKVHKGGYLYVSKNKYELKLPHVKAISNGVLSLMTDELNKVLYIDSVKSMNEIQEGREQDVKDLFNKNFRDQKLSIEKEETVSGEKCHRIKSTMLVNGVSAEMIWWVSKSGKLIMYAEKSGSGYTVFLIKNIGKVPAGHKFDFYFPREEKQELLGYKVFDFRYIKE
jgi:hypothetical protein